MGTTTLALVGATGGAGTTRTAVELAAMGARDGRDVAVVDAAFTTQGLSEHVAGRIDADLTRLVTDGTGTALAEATYPIAGPGSDAAGDPAVDADLPGTADAVPARAPFERLARAKTAEAARELERRIDEAAADYDAVVVDVPPVGSNEAVAAVTSVDRVAAVRPATAHGRDALQRLRGRVDDVDAAVSATVAVARPDAAAADAGDADCVLPATDPALADAPVAATGDGDYARAVAEAYGTLFDAAVGVDLAEEGVVERIR